MRYEALKRRLESLEKSSPSGTAILAFADGSTRSIKIADPLAILIQAMTRIGHATGAPEGREDDPEMIEWLTKPLPASKYDHAIELLGRATSIEAGEDNFMALVWEEAVQAVELEKKRELSGEMH